MNLVGKINESIRDYSESLSRLTEALVKVAPLNGIAEDSEIQYCGVYGVDFSCATFERAGELARLLLPIVGSFKKEFSSYDGKIRLVGELNGFPVCIYTTPSDACKITVEETEEVIPERIEKKKRYKLEGHCSPLLSDSDTEETDS